MIRWLLLIPFALVLAAGFPEGEVSVVRDNAKQLKFKPESTGFED